MPPQHAQTAEIPASCPSGSDQHRVFSRQAVLLIGGDKTGDDGFYERMVPIAEKIWHDYLEETGQKKPQSR